MVPGIGVNVRVTASCSQGGRKYMEDTFTVAYHPLTNGSVEYAYFGIFDGHGGDEASAFARVNLLNHIIAQEDFWGNDDVSIQKAIQKGFLDTHEAMWRGVDNWRRTPSGHTSTAGTTATVCFIKNTKLYIGHVGDSGVVLGYKEKGGGEWKPRPLTKDHKPDDPVELKRIQSCGGKVQLKSGIHRVVWNRFRVNPGGNLNRVGNNLSRSLHTLEEIPFLAVARSLGDLWSFNERSETYVVSPFPDVTTVTLNMAFHKCLVFGTDGLWNVLSPEAVVAIIQTCEINNCAGALLEKTFFNSGDGEGAVLDRSQVENKHLKWINPARKLVDVALQRWSENHMRADNTSVIVVMLDHPFETIKESCEEELNCTETMHVASGSEEGSEMSTRLNYTTSVKLVEPLSVAAAVKHELLCSSVDDYSRNGLLPSEDSCSHIVEGESSGYSVHPTVKEQSPVQEQIKPDDIDMSFTDESHIENNEKQFDIVHSDCPTEIVSNSTIDYEEIIETTSHSSVRCRKTLEKRRLKSHHKSRKNNLRTRECLTSLRSKHKMKRIQPNDRKRSTSFLRNRRSGWSKHSEKKVGSSHRPDQRRKRSLSDDGGLSFTAEQKRKRSMSDDGTAFSSSLSKKKALEDFSRDFKMNVSEQENNSQKFPHDTKSFESSAPWHCQNGKLLLSASSESKEIRSQSCDAKLFTACVSLRDIAVSQSYSLGTVNVPRAQKRSGALESDNEQLLSSHHKRNRSPSKERNSTFPSLVDSNKRETECDGELAAILSTDNSHGLSPILSKKKRSKSVDVTGGLSTPDDCRILNRRNQFFTCTPNKQREMVSSSHHRKKMTFNEQTHSPKHTFHKDENIYHSASTSLHHGTSNSSKSMKTIPVIAQTSCLNQNDEESYPSASTSSQKRVRSRSRDRKTMPVAEQTVFINHRNEKLHPSEATVTESRRTRSNSRDRQRVLRPEKAAFQNHRCEASTSDHPKKMRSQSHDRRIICTSDEALHLNHRSRNSSTSTLGDRPRTRSNSRENTNAIDRQRLIEKAKIEFKKYVASDEWKKIEVREKSSASSSDQLRTTRSHSHDRKIIRAAEQTGILNQREEKFSAIISDKLRTRSKSRERITNPEFKQSLDKASTSVLQNVARSNSRDRKVLPVAKQIASLTHGDEKSITNTLYQLRTTRSQSHDRKMVPDHDQTNFLNCRVESSSNSISGLMRTRSKSRERTINHSQQRVSEEARYEYVKHRTLPVSRKTSSLNQRDEKYSAHTSDKLTRVRSVSSDRKTISAAEQSASQKHKNEKSSDNSWGHQNRTRSKSRDRNTNLITEPRAFRNHKYEKTHFLSSASSHHTRMRSSSHERKAKPVASLNHKDGRSLTSTSCQLTMKRAMSCDSNTVPNDERITFQNHMRDHKSYLSLGMSCQQRRTRSNSHDRKIKYVAEKIEFSNSTRSERRHSSPTCKSRSVKRSHSYDNSALRQSARTHINRRSQSLAASAGDKQRSLPRDRHSVASFLADQKHCREQRDDKHSVSSRRLSDSETSRSEFKYEKRWSKRKKAPSTHICQLRRSAAGSRRKTCGSVIMSSSRSTCSSSSVETFKSVPSCKEQGRILRSVTAAVIAESLPIAKKLRSSSSVVPVPVNYFLTHGASLTT